MAFIGFTVPADAAAQLSKLHPTGDVTPPGEMHVTACYLGKDVGAQQIIRAIQACYVVANSFTPIRMTAAVLATFPPNPEYREGVPVIARIVSKELMDFREKMAASLDAFGVSFSKKFPDFKPHVTLSYDASEFAPRKIDPVSWVCSHLMVWGGNERFDNLFAGIQFAGASASA